MGEKHLKPLPFQHFQQAPLSKPRGWGLHLTYTKDFSFLLVFNSNVLTGFFPVYNCSKLIRNLKKIKVFMFQECLLSD